MKTEKYKRVKMTMKEVFKKLGINPDDIEYWSITDAKMSNMPEGNLVVEFRSDD